MYLATLVYSSDKFYPHDAHTRMRAACSINSALAEVESADLESNNEKCHNEQYLRIHQQICEVRYPECGGKLPCAIATCIY